MEIKDLGKTQLWRLRQDICLNSCYIVDYENRYGIDPNKVKDFMNGYLEYLEDLAYGDGFSATKILNAIYDIYDTKINLSIYAESIDWGN